MIKTRASTEREKDKNESLNLGGVLMDERLENDLVEVDIMPIAIGEDYSKLETKEFLWEDGTKVSSLDPT